MWFRALEDINEPIPEARNGDCFAAKKGELVKVWHRHVAKRLLTENKIGPPHLSHNERLYSGQPARKYSNSWRYGFFQRTSSHYSGGRLYMFQMAQWIAEGGGEVFIVTDHIPKWTVDYPQHRRIHVVLEDKDIPPDLDVVITDSKGEFGRKCLAYHRRHPSSLYGAVSFETPNWVAKYVPHYAQQLGNELNGSQHIFTEADFWITCSAEGAKFLAEWAGVKKPTHVVYPAVNTYALEESKKIDVPAPDNPFVLVSARPASYKQTQLVIDTIWSLDIPFDVVAFGKPLGARPDNELHRLHVYTNQTDAQKHALMAKAHLVCAPSLFEGYGMVPQEALASGTQCLVMDLPVLRESYGDRLLYVPWSKNGEYKEELTRMCKAQKPLIGTNHIDTFGWEKRREQFQSIQFIPNGRKRAFTNCIVYYGFLPQSIESVYEHCEEINVAFGPTPGAPPIDDGSLERLKAMPDPDNKIRIHERDMWAHKKEMREWCSSNSNGNFQILLDGDEIWENVEAWLRDGSDYGAPNWLNYWHSAEHYIRDSAVWKGMRWGSEVEPGILWHGHYRSSFWRKCFSWKTHSSPQDHTGDKLSMYKTNTMERMKACLLTRIHHVGHCLSREVMEAKHTYYKNRDGAPDTRREAWHNWNGKLGECGDGIVSKVFWELPQLVRDAAELAGSLVVL